MASTGLPHLLTRSPSCPTIVLKYSPLFAKSFGINLHGSNSAFPLAELINICTGVWICLGVFWMRSGQRGFQLLAVGERKKGSGHHS